MAVTVVGGALAGIDAVPIRVEVDLLRRLPRVTIVGLAAHAVQESAERIRSAIASIGAEFPRQRVVINLAPADVRKDGTALDLPIALGILAADGQIPPESLVDRLVVGELSLSGELRPVRGALSLAMLARERGWQLILPVHDAAQAALVPDVDVRGACTLAEVLDHLRGIQEIPRAQPSGATSVRDAVDLADVRGQQLARRAIEIAAAGAHNLLMVGPPGCGKSMLARRLSTVLPPLTFEEALETTRIHSAAGVSSDDPRLIVDRPFRAPHHTVTVAGLVGDRHLRPGEVSLAHNGVLFLDEASEFPRSALEVLRTPIEDGVVRLVRAEGSVAYPARIMLVLASNPCPCGRRGSMTPCPCTDGDVLRYQRRLSGPLLDRIDLYVELEPVPASALLDEGPGEPSVTVRHRVIAARDRAGRRGQRCSNAALTPADTDRLALATADARAVLRKGVEVHGLSGRSTARVLRVARTIADLTGDERVRPHHIEEALGFRPAPALS